MNTILTAAMVMGIIGFLFALLLAFLSRKLTVKEDPLLEKVMDILPGLNCGACGFSGCRPFAEAVIKERRLFNGCLPGGAEVNEEISAVLGISGCSNAARQIIACRCGAEDLQKTISTIYSGPLTCKSAHISGGALDCAYGCLAFGDCVKACPSRALTLSKGKIFINNKKCSGCKICVKSCPRGLFEIIPSEQKKYTCYVACNNKDKALQVKKVCKRGCIGCGICAKVENSPYLIKDNLSSVSYPLVRNTVALKEGKEKCPTRCIDEFPE